jgi:ATP-dependent DNA ligase
MARPLGGRRRTEATALPAWVKPQLTKLVDRPPDGPEWLHELKYDGCTPGSTGVPFGC